MGLQSNSSWRDKWLPQCLWDVPWQILIVIALLAIGGVKTLFLIPALGPVALFLFSMRCLFIAGLVKGWKWVWCLFLVMGMIHMPFVLLSTPFVAFMNLALLALVASAYRFYFPAGWY